MVNQKRAGKCGYAVMYVPRSKALRKLQLSLKDFRRLCVLKGIYPLQPSSKKKANKNSSTNKTYYHRKDIQYLAHEPLISKFRSYKTFIKHLRKAIGRRDQETRNRIEGKGPTFNFDHIVKERYPTFIDALRDIDDAISMCYLFSTFPRSNVVSTEIVHLCRRLIVELLHYVIASRSLRKVFISIKGFYYQAEIMGQLITWVAPHNFGFGGPSDVDIQLMVHFVEFYSTLLGFVNYKLFNTINLIYPPKLSIENLENVEDDYGGDELEYIAPLCLGLKKALESVVEDEAQLDEFNEFDDANLKQARDAEKKKEHLKKIFEKCKIFLNRETPKESLVFIIRCFGGEVSFDETVGFGSTFKETDETITHQIIDRPMPEKAYLNRFYVQPQWAYDSVNAGMLLPVEMYFPGVKLPPHLSPFVEEKEGDYIPPEKQALINMQKGITQGIRQVEDEEEDEFMSEDDGDDNYDRNEGGQDKGKLSEQAKKRKLESGKQPNVRNADKVSKMKVKEGVLKKVNLAELTAKELAEEKRLAIMMMPKKKKHLYDKIVFGQKRRSKEAIKLKMKREEYNMARKLEKRKKKNA